MASIYQPNGRQVWYVQYYHHGKRYQKSLKTRDKKLAEYRKREIENQLVRGDMGIDNPQVPVSRVFKEWITSCQGRLSPKTVTCYHSGVKVFLDHSGDMPIGSLSDRTLQDYLTHKSPTPHTANRLISYLKLLAHFAVKRNYISTSPFKDTKKFRVDTSPPKFLTKAQIQKLISAAEGETLYPAICTAVYTGMRLGEIQRLKVEDIDFKRGEIMVKKAKSRKFRVIPLHPQLAAILRPLKGHTAGIWVSTNHRRVFRRIARNAGIPGLGWHDLRHNFASWLAAQGVPMVVVKEYLGHASITTTARYSHLMPDKHKKEIVKISF